MTSDITRTFEAAAAAQASDQQLNGGRAPYEVDPWSLQHTDEPDAGPQTYDERFDLDVAREVRLIRIREAARGAVAAANEANTDFSGEYITRAGLLDLPKPEPLITKVLPRRVYAILRGRDQAFKSFVAIDWACCLATGKSWLGYATEPTRVLYVAGEGAHGLAARVEAWEYAWGRNVPDDMLTVRRAALNMHQPGPAFTDLLARIETDEYGLVIVDTLRRVSGAADGNGSEMGQVVDNLDRIKNATRDGTVLVVAHTDKNDNDSRGYSGIEDDADVVWSAKRNEMYLTLECNKMKDGPDGWSVLLQASTTLSSLTLSSATGIPAANTTETQLKILDTLREIFPDGATGPNLLSTCGLAKSTFYRAIRELIEGDHLANTGTKRSPYYELPALIETLPETAPQSTETHPPEDTLV